MGCGASSNAGAAAGAPPTANTTTTPEKRPQQEAPAAASAAATATAPAPADAAPADTKEKAAVPTESVAQTPAEAAAEQRAAAHRHIGGDIVTGAKAVIELGTQAAAKATAELQDAQASATFQKKSSDATSAAELAVGAISVLAGNDDVKRIVGGAWVLVSESAKVFTIGKVVVTVLEQIYSMWNAWDSKNRWVGEFIAYLKLVEIDLVSGMQTFTHIGFLSALQKQLESARDLLKGIQGRSKGVSFLMAMSDEEALQKQRVLLESRKQECLFGHVVEIKANTKESLTLLAELSDLIQERQRARRKLDACPEGEEAREQHDASLRASFDVMSPGSSVARYQSVYILAQRRRKWRAMQESERAEYVREYLADFVRPVPSNELEARVSVSPSLPLSLPLLGHPHLAAEFEAAREKQSEQMNDMEKAFFQALHPADQVTMTQQLQSSLAQSLSEMKALETAQPSEAATKAYQAYVVLDSLKNIAAVSSFSSSTPHSDSSLVSSQRLLFETIVSLRTAQQDRGETLSSYTPTLEELLAFSSVPAASSTEKLLYSTLFRTQYAVELAHLEWATQVEERGGGAGGQVAKRTHDMPTKGKLLLIKAPKATTVDAGKDGAVSPSSPASSTSSPAASRDLTCSIFLAFLVDLYPRIFRSIHFTPDAQTIATVQEKLTSGAILPEAAQATLEQVDLHRIFPSLSFQLAAHPDFLTYHANLRACWTTLTKEEFATMQPQDFLVDLLGAKWTHQGSTQENPNAKEEDDDDTKKTTTDGSASVSKVCIALDGGQFTLDSSAPSAAPSPAPASSFEFPSSLTTGLTKQLKETRPEWITMVVTLPPGMTQLERKAVALGHQPLQLRSVAIPPDA
jgi:hypothetical protein